MINLYSLIQLKRTAKFIIRKEQTVQMGCSWCQHSIWKKVLAIAGRGVMNVADLSLVVKCDCQKEKQSLGWEIKTVVKVHNLWTEKKTVENLPRVAGDPRKFSIFKQNRNMQSVKKKGRKKSTQECWENCPQFQLFCDYVLSVWEQ